jgi:hypothetical protein
MMVKHLLEEHYKQHGFPKLAARFILEPALIPELVEIAISNLNHPFPECASWLLIHIVKTNPELLEEFQPKFINCLIQSKNQSVLRNLCNTCSQLPLIDYKESEFLDKLIVFIKDDSNKVALSVYALYKLIHFTERYPEIKPEILGIIELKQTVTIQPFMRVGIRNYLKATSSID